MFCVGHREGARLLGRRKNYFSSFDFRAKKEFVKNAKSQKPLHNPQTQNWA